MFIIAIGFTVPCMILEYSHEIVMSAPRDCLKGGFMRVSSEDDIQLFYETVPEKKEFLFKLKSYDGQSLVNFSYSLKKGKELPYSVPLVGKKFVSS